MNDDDIEQLREDDDNWNDLIDSIPQAPGHGASTILGKTTTVTTYPTTAVCFYAIKPTTMLGNETEGATPTTTDASTTIYAVNIGSQIPPNGTIVVCTHIRYRWVFQYDGP